MPADHSRFHAFAPGERRIIAAALLRHAQALEAFHAEASSADGEGAETIQADAVLARQLLAGFSA